MNEQLSLKQCLEHIATSAHRPMQTWAHTCEDGKDYKLESGQICPICFIDENGRFIKRGIDPHNVTVINGQKFIGCGWCEKPIRINCDPPFTGVYCSNSCYQEEMNRYVDRRF